MTRTALASSILALGFVALAGVARADTDTTPNANQSLVAAAFAKPDATREAAPTAAVHYANPARVNASPTALDHQFSPDGVVGSVGYLCGIDKLDPDSYQRGGGPTSTYGHQGTFLGASLGFSFK